MHITVSEYENAAYIYLTDSRPRVSVTTEVEIPQNVPCEIFLDWSNGQLVGIEIVGLLGLHDELKAKAEIIG